MATVFHLPSSSPVRIATTRSKHSHWLMRSHFCRESEDDRAIVLIACWATVVMTRRQSGKVCVLATFRLCSPSETLNMAVDWGNGGGWWNVPLRG